MANQTDGSIICRAAVLYTEGKAHKIENIRIPPARDGEVRIRMISAGICASDAHHAWGDQLLSSVIGHRAPAVLGHEGAGIVESRGNDIQDVEVGDHVLVSIMPQCRKCAFCTSGRTSNCMTDNLFVLGSYENKFSLDGTPICSFTGLGIFSEYVLLKRSQIVKIPKSTPIKNACIISCAVATGYYSAVNIAQVVPDTVAVVFGIGAIGINALFGCKKSGAKHIIAVDINDEKKDVAIKYGATEFVNSKNLDKKIEDYLLEKYGGVDYAFDCVGHPAIIESGLNSLNAIGRYVQIGLPHPETTISYPAWKMISGKSITSGLLGNKPVNESYLELAEMYRNGEYDVDSLVTHRFTLDQIDDAFALLKQGKCVRSVIDF